MPPAQRLHDDQTMMSSRVSSHGRPSSPRELFRHRLLQRALKKVKLSRAERANQSRMGIAVDAHALANMILTESAIHNADVKMGSDDDSSVGINENSNEGKMTLLDETSCDSSSSTYMDCAPLLSCVPRYETKEDLDAFLGTVEYQEMLEAIEDAIANEMAEDAYQSSHYGDDEGRYIYDSSILSEGSGDFCTPPDESFFDDDTCIVCPFCKSNHLLVKGSEASCRCGQTIFLGKCHNGSDANRDSNGNIIAEVLRMMLAFAIDLHSSCNCTHMPLFSSQELGSLHCHCPMCNFSHTVM